jgi:translation elongation factor P/translation initiation factor 5A
VVSVIASQIRKGQVVEKDGKLYVVLTAENTHPGKGTPVTQLEMRRISDGVKVTDRYKTTDTIEKAFVEERPFNYLYHDGDHYIFMDPENFEQISVLESIIGDAVPFLLENMEVQLSTHNGTPIAIELPARDIGSEGNGARDQGPDRIGFVQARDIVERRAHDGADTHRAGRTRCRADGRRILRRTRQGLARVLTDT